MSTLDRALYNAYQAMDKLSKTKTLTTKDGILLGSAIESIISTIDALENIQNGIDKDRRNEGQI